MANFSKNFNDLERGRGGLESPTGWDERAPRSAADDVQSPGRFDFVDLAR